MQLLKVRYILLLGSQQHKTHTCWRFAYLLSTKLKLRLWRMIVFFKKCSPRFRINNLSFNRAFMIFHSCQRLNKYCIMCAASVNLSKQLLISRPCKILELQVILWLSQKIWDVNFSPIWVLRRRIEFWRWGNNYWVVEISYPRTGIESFLAAEITAR